MGKVGGVEVQDHFERFWVYIEQFQGLGDQETQKRGRSFPPPPSCLKPRLALATEPTALATAGNRSIGPGSGVLLMHTARSEVPFRQRGKL